MAIQDLINEVNSIQTKKQAIKEAITAKGVTSEGRLSKFADEIKQITTKEPDWYIVNKFRYDNGNEALFVRTSDKTAVYADKYQMVEIGGGVTKSNSISNSFNYSYNDDIGITNGTYFPRETACRSFTTKDSFSVVFDGHNDNLKLTFNNGKEIIFNDVNVYNWLKGYRNQPLADFNTLYLKSDGISGKAAKTLKDFLASSNETRMSTLGEYGQNPLLLIDSSIMIQAMNLRKMPKTGFIYYSDKTVDAVSLIPVLYTNTNSDIPFYENKEQLYGNLSPGNYVHLIRVESKLLVVFIGANFVIDDNNQKHKNIEVYVYDIAKEDGGRISFFKITDKPFELYITFSNQAQQQLQQASSIKIFRRQVLAANGTPEPREGNFLTGSDALIKYEAKRDTSTHHTTVQSLYYKYTDYINLTYLIGPRGRFDVMYSGGGLPLIHSQMFSDIYKQDSKVTGIIRIGEDMNYIELQKVTSPVERDDISHFSTAANDFIFLPDGIGLFNTENKAMFLTKAENNLTGYAYTIKKSDNTEVTTALYPTDKQVSAFIYLTTNAETQRYIKSKPLATIWTEIQGVLAHKEDYEAYNEE